MSFEFEKSHVGDLINGDEFEFMNSAKPWRVIQQGKESSGFALVMCLNGKGISRMMKKTRACFKRVYTKVK